MKKELILETINITKNFFGDKSSGVNNITLLIPKGKITGIVGESGSGKTTLLKLLAGTLVPDSGEVFFHQELLPDREKNRQDVHRSIKFLTQDNYEMDLQSTVWENVRDGLAESEQKFETKKVSEALTQWSIRHLHDQVFGKLSGGEKQRVTIAKALISKPEVLLLDEPFNQVDAHYRESLQQDIRDIVAGQGVTAILVSHDPAELLSMADQLVVIKEGEIVESGSPEDLYESPQLLYTALILASGTQLTPTQAKVCGVSTKRGSVVVYAEDVKVSRGLSNNWMVNKILFKGIYEELIVEYKNVQLRVLNRSKGKYKIGSKVSVSVKKYHEFGRWS
ncbi:ABC transporter ATP-binding protein [Mucilaginibacter myungsuensis]|uniref:ATP-binding cassette domain-containing protein n=1 Tax=Mucilaginibacter myungsuensis TaxID=649104 RepID=A0A929PY66_9SPHI|nr:ATP-binding cassette domain-containing protein [Mucilaginibacter myungsuensis]MBE9663859.1 ATP-binding cassette domain-containing protein [Mucilaginibacter myungsuensis]MDN3598426.1 ATP-binding cassette domain-containing protein [Mucilaginibacter myungsuensis]